MRKLIVFGLLACLIVPVSAQRKKDTDEKKSGSSAISVMDSTEAQWGRRSINDSIYRGYTVNAVYLERGRQRLPESFNMYKPTPITVVSSKKNEEPTTMKVNGKETKLLKE